MKIISIRVPSRYSHGELNTIHSCFKQPAWSWKTTRFQIINGGQKKSLIENLHRSWSMIHGNETLAEIK